MADLCFPFCMLCKYCMEFTVNDAANQKWVCIHQSKLQELLVIPGSLLSVSFFALDFCNNIIFHILYCIKNMHSQGWLHIYWGGSEIRCMHQTQISSSLPLNNVSNVTDILPVPFLKLQTNKNPTAFPKPKFCYAIWGWSSGKASTWTVKLMSPSFWRRERDWPRTLWVQNWIFYQGLFHIVWAFTPQTVAQMSFNY